MCWTQDFTHPIDSLQQGRPACQAVQDAGPLPHHSAVHLGTLTRHKTVKTLRAGAAHIACLGVEAASRLVGVVSSKLHRHTTPHRGLQTRQAQHKGTTALPADYGTHCTQAQTVCTHALPHKQAAHQRQHCLLYFRARARTPMYTPGRGTLDSSPSISARTHHVATMSLLQSHR